MADVDTRAPALAVKDYFFGFNTSAFVALIDVSLALENERDTYYRSIIL